MTGRTGRGGQALAVQPWTPRHAAPATSNGAMPAAPRPQPAGSPRPGRADLPGSRPARGKGAGLLTVASCLLLVLAAAQGYVSFRAQYAFVDHAKRAHLPSLLEALGLDTGAVIFALLALSLARRGRRAAVERVLNVTCALGSLTMNLLAADLASPRSVTVWVLPSALYALASDRLVAVVRSWAQASDPGAGIAREGSAWRALGGLALWVLRLVFDLPGTVAGFRRWVLAVAPVAPGTRASGPPIAEGQLRLPTGNGKTIRNDLPHLTADQNPVDVGVFSEPHRPADPPPHHPPADHALAPGETKRAALIRLYEQRGKSGDPRYGNRAKASQLSGEIAAQINYHPGTARRELARYLATQAKPSHNHQPATDTEAVT
jgi:hypothetical protein